MRCAAQENIDGLIDSQSRENWRNKTVSQETKAKQKFKRLETITPAVQANNKQKLSAIKWDNKEVEITWACPFDAIFQLTLSAAVHSDIFLKNVVHHKSRDNLFLDLIKDTEETRAVTFRTLQKRFQILKKYFPLEKQELRSGKYKWKIQCDESIRDMYVKLFTDIPSFEEEIFCDSGCPLIREAELLYSRSLKTLMTGDASQIEGEIMVSKSCELGCSSGRTTNKLGVSGDFLCFELFSGFEKTDQVMLADIPTQMQLSSMPESFQLIGIIHVDPPYRRAQSRDQRIYSTGGLAHYVPFCLQKNGWHRYDVRHDLKSPTTRVNPSFIMYVRVTQC